MYEVTDLDFLRLSISDLGENVKDIFARAFSDPIKNALELPDALLDSLWDLIV